MQTGRWKFDDPPNVAVFTTRAIMDGLEWIAVVFHDAEDGAWQFHGLQVPKTEDAVVLGLGEVIERDASLIELHDLRLGYSASRSSPEMPWTRRAA